MEKSEGTHRIPNDIQEILDSRDQLDQLLREKFTQHVAVMFADLKGSTEYFQDTLPLGRKTDTFRLIWG